MVSLLLGLSLMNATDNKELTTCKFLDEFYDYTVSHTEQLDSQDDTLYIELEEVEFLPDDIESTCDFTTTTGVNSCQKDIHT